MRILREMGWGFVIAIVSLLVVVGGVLLSLSENTPAEEPTPSPMPPSIATSIELPTNTPIIANTNTPETPTPTLTFTALPSATLAAPVVCTPPVGWIRIVVGANDTLYSIAERHKTTAEVLSASNCLNNTLPTVGSSLYVPPIPTVTVVPCRPYTDWIKAYHVQPGDNLYRISLLYRTTVTQLQFANCMGSSIIIYAGQVLWVPNVATSTPGVTIIPSFNTATATPTPTSTFIVTESPVPSPTNSFTPPPTFTPSLTPFPSQTPTTPSP